jgi:LacI family transcriptional regulator
LDYDKAYLFQTGYKAAKKLLETGKHTCFLCLSDVLAIGAMKAVHEKGLRVPQDISIVGFDGIENGAYTNPTLTTFVQPFEEMADKSVTTLLGLISGECEHRHFILNTTLERGKSFAG